ncbi:Nicotinamidase-related amidase [Nocardia farcinica]|jgi:nicotinamidase-related amidase|uniref:Putative hydrolase n=1 Tax=Nocardia farcinica TaxID=37329 RepID=A0A0H5PB36_NOCFR|nr:isochorismatase family cysteine hydrolase [Nocardia farcinica]PFW98440.1 Vibriobactin-specific isochorismatase [Nocardia farcinica]PFX02084.1 Vibriobactin-specific isochorismatase [Nocardia farcinica]CRY84623.1 putative hydrolase [Nocardia farcinica]SIT34641.1 Nicotinamidase-related amidase [Nocardia farcinica]SUH41114.1 isochorismatase [Nocardia farcinica]
MIDIDKAALLVVDVQNGFVNEFSAHVVPVIADLATRWARTGRPTVFTRYWNYAGSPWERLIGWKALYGPPETDIVAELGSLTTAPGAHTLDKTVYTALTPEGLRLLRTLDVTDLVICGIATDACVLKTALDAFEHGYTPWVLRDAVASNATRHRAAEIHESALLHISRLVGAQQVTETASIDQMLAADQAATS